jgi:tetratricopeptide (TPR) repeat protein
MSFQDKLHERKSEAADAPSHFRRPNLAPRESSSAFARWLLPAISLTFACAGLVILVVKNRSGSQALTTSELVEKNDGQRISFPAGTNLPAARRNASNTRSADTGVDLTVKLVTEGNDFLQRGNYAEAAARYAQAVRIDPGDEDLHYNLGIALAKLGQIEEAKKHYEESLKIFPDYVEAHNNLGNLLMNENRLAEAIAHFQEAIRIMPENGHAHNNLGTAFGRQGNVRAAIAEFAEAVKRQPAYVEARVNLANAYLVQEQVDEAVAELSEALRLQPDFQPAINAMHRARLRQSSSGVPK